jgi:hypothetical protein
MRQHLTHQALGGEGILLFFIKYMKSTLSTHGATCKAMLLIENIILKKCMTTNISDAKSFQKIRMMTSPCNISNILAWAYTPRNSDMIVPPTPSHVHVPLAGLVDAWLRQSKAWYGLVSVTLYFKLYAIIQVIDKGNSLAAKYLTSSHNFEIAESELIR